MHAFTLLRDHCKCASAEGETTSTHTHSFYLMFSTHTQPVCQTASEREQRAMCVLTGHVNQWKKVMRETSKSGRATTTIFPYFHGNRSWHSHISHWESTGFILPLALHSCAITPVTLMPFSPLTFTLRQHIQLCVYTNTKTWTTPRRVLTVLTSLYLCLF